MTNEELAKKIECLEKELEALKAQVKPEPEVPTERKPWPKYDPTEGFRLPPSAAKAMAAIVPDVKNQKGFDAHAWAETKVAEPGGFGEAAKPEKQVERGTGYQKALPLEPPPGIKHVDAIAKHFEEIDKADDIGKRIARAVMGQKIK